MGSLHQVFGRGGLMVSFMTSLKSHCATNDSRVNTGKMAKVTPASPMLAIPQIDDNRVEFFKGWFETLPKYRCPPHEVLVINLDADLYSPTISVLRALQINIVPGTYIY